MLESQEQVFCVLAERPRGCVSHSEPLIIPPAVKMAAALLPVDHKHKQGWIQDQQQVHALYMQSSGEGGAV